MRRLLLLRHAKAERSHSGGRDHDRILTERGRANSRRLGAYLAHHTFIPDRVLVSTSARTRETWALMAAAFGKVPEAKFEDRIYDASPPAILKAVQATEADVGTLLLIGHNPALQETAAALIASGDVEARQRLNEEFPTSALAAISFAVEDWRGVHPRSGRLEHFVTPHWLETAD